MGYNTNDNYCSNYFIVYVLKGIYIIKFNLEGSLKGFKLSFETKNGKDTLLDTHIHMVSFL